MSLSLLGQYPVGDDLSNAAGSGLGDGTNGIGKNFDDYNANCSTGYNQGSTGWALGQAGASVIGSGSGHGGDGGSIRFVKGVADGGNDRTATFVLQSLVKSDSDDGVVIAVEDDTDCGTVFTVEGGTHRSANGRNQASRSAMVDGIVSLAGEGASAPMS